MSEIFCTLSREELLSILHHLQFLKEIFESRMVIFNERERQQFFASKNRIHEILEEASKARKEATDD